MGFSRQEYWSGLPFPSPGDLPHPGMEPRSPALKADALQSEPPGKSHVYNSHSRIRKQASLAFTRYRGGAEGRRKRKVLTGGGRRRRLFKEQSWAGAISEVRRAFILSTLTFLSMGSTNKEVSTVWMGLLLSVFVNRCRPHLISPLRRREGALRIGILRVPLESLTSFWGEKMPWFLH